MDTSLAPPRGSGEKSGGTSASGYRLVALGAEGTVEFDLPAGGEFGVGRTTGAFIVLDDASVSRSHAILRLGSAELAVFDQGSRNGTFVNGARVGASGARVMPGDELRFGNVRATLLERGRQGAAASRTDAREFERRVAAEGERAVRHERTLAALCVSPLMNDEATEPLLADSVAACLRPYDVTAWRDGRLLHVLLPECTQDGALRIAHRIDAVLRDRGLAARIGVAAFPSTAPSVESLFPSADVARRSVTQAGVGVARPATRVFHAAGRSVVAGHPSMLQVFALAERLAHGSGAVLVMGEPGAGATTVADAIHALGPRADRPLVHLDCASTPPAQLAQELLGTDGGPGEGIRTATIGVLEFASGGTIVLQEIGRLPAELQAVLLQVMKTQSYTRLGASTVETVDVRIVATASSDLELACAEGAFRRDLHALLQETCIVVPSLRARRLEIPLLARWFADETSAEAGRQAPTFSAGAEAALRRYSWPGNVEELRRVVADAVRRCPGDEIQVSHLPAEIAESWTAPDDGSGWDTRFFQETSVVSLAPAPRAPEIPAETPAEPRSKEAEPPAVQPVFDVPADRPYDETIELVQRLLVERAMRAAQGALPKAAAMLGVDRRRLVRLLDRLGIER